LNDENEFEKFLGFLRTFFKKSLSGGPGGTPGDLELKHCLSISASDARYT
jgi:hypothetical protein